MRNILLVLCSTLLLVVGCSSGTAVDTDSLNSDSLNSDTLDSDSLDSDSLDSDSLDSDTLDSAAPGSDSSGSDQLGSEEGLVAAFAGATFVSLDQLETGVNANGEVSVGNWTVSFTYDTVIWSHSDVVDIGSYSVDAEAGMVATFSDRDVAFSADGGDLTWDSLSYRRTANSLFNSQESLVSYLDNATFKTIDRFDVGEDASGVIALGSWSLRFVGDEVSWSVQDTIAVGAYSYIDDSSFAANFSDENVKVYVLPDGELMLNSLVYKKELASQFNSQESLVAFLDGETYKSNGLKPIGESSSGTTALGHWYIDFSDNTFSWSYQDVAEVGSYTYLDDSSFTAILYDREYTIEVQGDDIIWDGTRYFRELGM